MKDLKFEVSIPVNEVERLIQFLVIGMTGRLIPGVKVKMQEEFIPSHGTRSEKSGPKPKEHNIEDIASVISEYDKSTSTLFKDEPKLYTCNKNDTSTIKKPNRGPSTRLIAFRCDCGHITWRLCRDGVFECECNHCGKVHEWSGSELYKLEYFCKCGYRKYLYMPLSHQIEEIKCGSCKAPIDIKFNEKTNEFKQVK